MSHIDIDYFKNILYPLKHANNLNLVNFDQCFKKKKTKKRNQYLSLLVRFSSHVAFLSHV